MDAFIKDLPKFLQLADDMHNLTLYINDLRIVTITMAVTAYVGGLVYLVLLCNKHRRKKRSRRLDIDGADTGNNLAADHDVITVHKRSPTVIKPPPMAMTPDDLLLHKKRPADYIVHMDA